MTATHRRPHIAVAILAAVVIAATLMAACSARASGGSSDGNASDSSPGASGSAGVGQGNGSETSVAQGARAASNSDWSRVLAALASMQASTPTEPVVILLGGSAARESTIDDASWRQQIEAKGGPATLAWNMGSRNRTMAQNLAIVKALPRGARAVVLIGVNLGSFTSSQKAATIDLPAPAADEVGLQQPHHYSTRTGILPSSKKKLLVKQWLADRYPVYKANFGTSASVLEKVIQTCRTRGYKPVLLELPRNTQIIGGSLAAPTRKYRDKCVALHRKYGIPWISLVSAARIPNPGFYDLWHLVEPGRTVWQDLLSARTAALLERYGFGAGS